MHSINASITLNWFINGCQLILITFSWKYEFVECTKVPFNLLDPTESCFKETTLGGVGGTLGESSPSVSSITLGVAIGDVGLLDPLLLPLLAAAMGTNRSLILAYVSDPAPAPYSGGNSAMAAYISSESSASETVA